MAVVAAGDALVARVQPRVVVRLHDVAVDAGLRIVDEVGPPLAVAEREHALAHEHADADRRRDRQRRETEAPPWRGGRARRRGLIWRRGLGHARHILLWTADDEAGSSSSVRRDPLSPLRRGRPRTTGSFRTAPAGGIPLDD